MEYCPHCMRPTEGSICSHCGKPVSWLPGEQQLPAGTMLDGSGLHRYITGAAIGQGGFGITYIAVEADSGIRVAVKECFPVQCAMRAAGGVKVEAKPGMASQLQGALNSFLDEARLLAKQKELKSVVQVEDFFSTNGTAYLVMEYLDGVTLSDKMKAEGRLPAPQLLSMLRPLMEDIGKLHASGIIHRDISPDNIMWMPDNLLKLLDFGCARSMEDGKSMSVLLKHGFAPVEQYQTRGQGPWTDIYSLCATVYYCITGTMPTSAVERLEGDALVPPSALGAELTPKEETALLWGLAVQPTRRPQHIELLIDQLCPEVPKRPKRPARPKTPRHAGKREDSGHSSTKRKRVIGIAAAAIVLVIVLIAAFSGNNDDTYGPSVYNNPTKSPYATAAPSTSSPSPAPSPVSGVSDGLEYLDYGDYIVVTGCDGEADDVLVVPDEINGVPVTEIGDAAFQGQVSIISAMISGSVEKVGSQAFAGCSSLRMLLAYQDMEIGDDAFDGCSKLRALFKANDFDADPDAWGFAENVMTYASGMDTGAGELFLVYVSDDSVIYGITDDETAVVMDIPAGLSTVTLAETISSYPVVWMYTGALDHADSDVKVYLATSMGFPYEIRNDASWSFKDDCGPDSFCFNWYLSCYLADETNDRRADGAEQIVPVREYVEAAMQRSQEIVSIYQHDRPDGSKFSTIFDEFGIDIVYSAQWIDHFPIDELETELLNCAKSLVEKSDSYGVYYTYMGAATCYSNDEVYLCRLAGADG